MYTSTRRRLLILSSCIAVALSAIAVPELPDTKIITVLDEDAPLMLCIRDAGMTCQTAETPLHAISNAIPCILVVDASPDNLRILAEAGDAVQTFTEAGGWIILCGLFPDGLQYFNRIVGVEHLLRSFQMEEVELAKPVDPLLRGLTSSDVFLESGEWTTGPNAIPMRAANMFSYIVDIDDIAPFAGLPAPAYWGIQASAPGIDQWPANMVNGLTYHTDFGFTIRAAEGQPLRWPLTLPRPESITGFSLLPGADRHGIEEIALYFDDDTKPTVFPVAQGRMWQDFRLGARTAKQITIEVSKRAADESKPLAIQNIRIAVNRSDDFRARVKPLLSVGGLVKYPMGRGGVILNQLHILEKESNPVNGEKKRQIAHTLLRNLAAGF